MAPALCSITRRFGNAVVTLRFRTERPWQAAALFPDVEVPPGKDDLDARAELLTLCGYPVVFVGDDDPVETAVADAFRLPSEVLERVGRAHPAPPAWYEEDGLPC